MENTPNWVTIFVTIFAALGGYEGVKYLLNLRSKKKKEKAEADKVESESDMAEVEVIEKRLKMMGGQLLEQEAKMKNLRDELYTQMEASDVLKKKLLNANSSIVELQKNITRVTAAYELAKEYECLVENCELRQPPKKIRK